MLVEAHSGISPCQPLQWDSRVGIHGISYRAQLMFSSEHTLLTSRSSDLAIVFDVDSHAPARSRQAPNILALPVKDRQIPFRATAPLRIGDVRRDDRDTSHLVTLAIDGALRTFALRTDSEASEMDLDISPSDADRWPNVTWDEDIRTKATALEDDADTKRDWQDKAAAKHKMVDLRWAWQGEQCH